jgi:hypothetical protein
MYIWLNEIQIQLLASSTDTRKRDPDWRRAKEEHEIPVTAGRRTKRKTAYLGRSRRDLTALIGMLNGGRNSFRIRGTKSDFKSTSPSQIENVSEFLSRSERWPRAVRKIARCGRAIGVRKREREWGPHAHKARSNEHRRTPRINLQRPAEPTAHNNINGVRRAQFM